MRQGSGTDFGCSAATDFAVTTEKLDSIAVMNGAGDGVESVSDDVMVGINDTRFMIVIP